jgi:hypothetical protein
MTWVVLLCTSTRSFAVYPAMKNLTFMRSLTLALDHDQSGNGILVKAWLGDLDLQRVQILSPV